MFRYIFLLISIFLCIPPAWAGSEFVAVLEFQGNAEDQILMQLSDEVRGGIREGLPRQKYSISTRENIRQILEDQVA